MSTIIFTAGAKGGTGKSTALRFLITYLREKGFSPLLLDMDDENRTMSRFFPEARQIEIKKMSSNDVLIETVIEDGEELIIADLKAGTGRDTLQWWMDIPFNELPDIKFICIASITSSPDSIQSVLNWTTELKERVSYVICMNCKDGDVFPDYDKSAQAVRFRLDYKPIEILIPRLDEEYMTELERLNLTVAEVLDADGHPHINDKSIEETLSRFMVRARLRRFQRNIYEQFHPVLELLKEGN